MEGWRVPVVVYHHVAPGSSDYTNTPPEDFERHLSELSTHYQFWTVKEAWEAFVSGRSASNRLLLTFDDGYEDNIRYAAPLLETHGACATFFVLSDFTGRSDTWNRRFAERSQHLSAAHLRELQRAGHSVGSHGRFHRRLTDLPLREVVDELRVSRLKLEDLLGEAVLAFSYPYGSTTESVNVQAATHYSLAFSTVKSGHRDWRVGRYGLRRFFLKASLRSRQIAAHLAVEGDGF